MMSMVVVVRMRVMWIALALAVTVAWSGAGVYDDCAAWWQFDYDSDSDGLVQLDEVRDQRGWGSAAAKDAAGQHATSIHGIPEWTTTSVTGPAGGLPCGDTSLYLTPATNAAGDVWPDAFKVSTLSLSGSCTLVTRLRWDGYASDASSAWICNNGFVWGADDASGGGWLFGVRDANHHLALLFGHGHWYDTSLIVSTGTWYDVALVVTDNGATDTLEFYLWGATNDLQYARIDTDGISSNVGSGMTFGVEATSTGYASGTSNAKKAFKGPLNHLAVWDRALPVHEVHEAFGAPRHVFKLGLENDHNRDLRMEGEVDEAYTLGEPWHEMRRAVNGGSNPRAIVSFTLTADEAALDYIFHLDTAGTQSGTAADISIHVNGQDMGRLTVNEHQDHFWHVYRQLLVAGVNTLEIRYEGGPSGWLSFDWMELAGSWQVGIDNGTPGEFINENLAPDDFYVTNPEWDDLERANTHTDRDINLHFVLSDELVAGYSYVYTTRVVQQGGTATPHPIDVLVNGTLVRSFPPQVDGTLLTVDMGNATLVSGDNTITLRNVTTSGWAQYDFHRLLVTAVPPDGTVFIVR